MDTIALFSTLSPDFDSLFLESCKLAAIHKSENPEFDPPGVDLIITFQPARERGRDSMKALEVGRLERNPDQELIAAKRGTGRSQFLKRGKPYCVQLYVLVYL
jgi:hypothetical protein